MSLRGQINKVSGEIKRSVNQMVAGNMTDLHGAIRGTKKIFGYVCEIHEEGDLAGTVDVQEFGYEPDEYTYKGAGLHKGVLLSAIQNNQEGVRIVPMLFSEVVLIESPTDRKEYVLMYSHASQIRHTAHSIEGKDDGSIELGVTEVEDFVETDDGLEKDYNELEPTKNKTNTLYTATSITDQVISPDDEEGFRQEVKADSKTITVGDTKITIDGQNVTITTSGKVQFDVNGDCEIKGKTVTITGGTLKTKGTSSTDMQGPFNSIMACPFSGAPHCGSTVSGT